MTISSTKKIVERIKKKKNFFAFLISEEEAGEPHQIKSRSRDRKGGEAYHLSRYLILSAALQVACARGPSLYGINLTQITTS
jgi:hypothetical protein